MNNRKTNNEETEKLSPDEKLAKRREILEERAKENRRLNEKRKIISMLTVALLLVFIITVIIVEKIEKNDNHSESKSTGQEETVKPSESVRETVELSEKDTKSPEETEARTADYKETKGQMETEKPGETPTEALTETPYESSTEAPSEVLTEAPTETSTEVFTETSTEKESRDKKDKEGKVTPDRRTQEATKEPENNKTATDKLPSWITEDLLTVSGYNRPGTVREEKVNNIVIHYVGNAGSSAKANRDYFENLANPKANPEEVKASSHFIVGLKGEVIQCVPIGEIAWANRPRNGDTISIETCHPDESGKFSDVTYASLVKLSALLLQKYGLDAETGLIRHYECSGKYCPLYYVEHPDAWQQFKDDVAEFMKLHPDVENEFP